MDIQFAYTILYVKDVPASLAFYKNALGFQEKFSTPEMDYGELVSGQTTIAFANLELGRSNFKKGFQVSGLNASPFGIELAFTTVDVEHVMENAINHGAELLEAAVTKPWGQTVGYLRDPNGFILEICTPMKG
ncbi:MAG: VOC family protein [Bacteroidota bacterium]